MADKEKKGIKKLTTGMFRVSFPHVFKAQTTPSGEQRYSVVMLIPKGDKETIKALQELAKKAAYEKWSKDAVDSKKLKINMPFRDGEEKADQYDGYEGMVFATASSKNKPKVVKKNKDGTYEPLTDDSEFYAGCYARAAVNAYAWEWKGKKGVSFGLINLLKAKDGERFGFSSNPEDDFEDAEGTDDSEGGDTEYGDTDEDDEKLFG